MKTWIISFVIALIGFANPVLAKTTIEVLQQNNKNGSSLIAFKELRDNGDAMGVVFICPKDQDEAHVILINPRSKTGEVETVYRVKFIYWKGETESESLTPISTIGDGLYNLGVGFSKMKNTNYAASYSLRFYNAIGRVIDETRRVPDSEFKRLLANQYPLTGCGISNFTPPGTWEYYTNFSFDEYAQYKK